ncbi:homoserine kinase [Brevibacterium jeotgali]|uniref:Homoserine kinase n=1 Tax=Brevibacterium jeotgali TaxID=1262550 RepID=A0A2H1L8P2_9MICO|nr:homoserine kinase [Brevibacterium jeotgali]TWC03178.1 homoserine kinase [Brevibacterium jeotgali]SMY12763.1 homoserine kinase [Brevibacterium jeotgali]
MSGFRIPAGFSVEVTAPATSANLGAGYDSFGLALGVADTVRARVADADVPHDARAVITGEGADFLPRSGDHLILRVAEQILAAREVAGGERLVLECENAIPQSRGMGSSAAAVVAGLSIADAASTAAGLPEPTAAEKLAWATHFEGHPDNAAPALFGGVTVSWYPEADRASSISLPVHPEVRAAVVVPDERLDTDIARELLPRTVPHADAAANSAVAGLFVHAICHDPSLLVDATVDRLHQEYRRPAMLASLERVDALRAAGLAAVVSGAGPTVLVLGTGEDLADRVSAVLAGDGARVLQPQIAENGATTLSLRSMSA